MSDNGVLAVLVAVVMGLPMIGLGVEGWMEHRVELARIEAEACGGRR